METTEDKQVGIFKTASLLAAEMAVREPVSKSMEQQDILVMGFSGLDENIRLNVAAVIDGDKGADVDTLRRVISEKLMEGDSSTGMLVSFGRFARVPMAELEDEENRESLYEEAVQSGEEAIVVSLETFDKCFLTVFSYDEKTGAIEPIMPVEVSEWSESDARIKDIVPHGAPEGVKLN